MPQPVEPKPLALPPSRINRQELFERMIERSLPDFRRP